MTITNKQNSNSRRYFNMVGFLIGWFSIIGQLVLMFQNRQATIFETIIRFFSFFTILTNLLVALYFTSTIPIFKSVTLGKLNKGTLTALTTFILVVGLIYQVVLRSTWHPTGFQRIIDELLHSVIPFFVLVYWLLFADEKDLEFKNCIKWLWFPVLYFVYILIRGHFSKFYPYPFINVPEIGYIQVAINFVIISGFVLALMGILIYIGHKIKK